MEIAVHLMNPVVPHLTEEIWSEWGNKDRLVFMDFPESESTKRNPKVEDKEQYLRDLMDDVESIKQAMKTVEFKRMALYVADPWKYVVYNLATSDITGEALIKKAMQDSTVREYGREVVKYCQRLQREFPRTRNFDRAAEYATLSEAKRFLTKSYNCDVTVEYAHDSSDPRARLADPFRPAISLS